MGSITKRKEKRRQQIEMVKVIMGDKVWEMNTIGALAIINMAKEKFENEGKHAIVAVKRGNIYSLLKETFSTKEDMLAAASDWTKGSYSPFYTNTQMKERKDGEQ